VTIAGIRVGHVDSVTLDGGTAVVVLRVKRDIVIEDDSIASIKTKGLMGGKYVQISPGGSEKLLKQGGSIIDTESAMDPERLISKYVFGKV
jgi:phospholipid/cholesterol/gamma-HCH transport system substrate-binding protein